MKIKRSLIKKLRISFILELMVIYIKAVEIEQIAYLDFKTFYDNLYYNVKKEVRINPEKKRANRFMNRNEM